MSPHRPAPLMNFLTLSPVTSSSFPKAQQAKPASGGEIHKRRSSSLSSVKSSPSSPTFKVLKVAPVHYGEHIGEHQDDWHEVAVE